jgi:hypothetical protein
MDRPWHLLAPAAKYVVSMHTILIQSQGTNTSAVLCASSFIYFWHLYDTCSIKKRLRFSSLSSVMCILIDPAASMMLCSSFVLVCRKQNEMKRWVKLASHLIRWQGIFVDLPKLRHGETQIYCFWQVSKRSDSSFGPKINFKLLYGSSCDLWLKEDSDFVQHE